MTRKEMLNLPYHDLTFDGELENVSGVYIIPSGRKHESGWTMMNLIATFYGGKQPVLFAQVCDDISLEGEHFRIDCSYPHRIIHIWNSRSWKKGFRIEQGISSISFVED